MLDITVLAPEGAGIASIAPLKDELMTAMDKADKGSSIVLDLSGTNHADSSLAQLVIAFEAEAAARGLKATIKGAEGAMSLRALLCSDSVSPRDDKAKRAVAAAEGSRP